MANKVKTCDSDITNVSINDESIESELIHLAVAQARKQLSDGTASSQVVTHLLKLAAEKEKRSLELEILERQKDLVTAKTEALKTASRLEKLFDEAKEVFSIYSGDAHD